MKFQLILLAACLSASGGESFEETNSVVQASALSESESSTAPSPVVSDDAEVDAEVSDDFQFPKSDNEAEGSSLERPKNLIVVAASQRSISLRWDFSPTAGNIDGYRIYYVHENFKDVKTFLKATPACDLHGLGKNVEIKAHYNLKKKYNIRIFHLLKK